MADLSTEVISGTLKKRMSLIMGYLDMWFVLKTDGYLRFFKIKPKDENKGKQPNGRMLLLLSDIITKRDGVSFRLISASNAIYRLRAANPVTRDKWIQALNEVRTAMYNRMFKGMYAVQERLQVCDGDTDSAFDTKDNAGSNGDIDGSRVTASATNNIASLFTERIKPYIAVAAIDFGTTYSGCAFATVQQFKTNPLNIETIALDDQNMFSNSYKTPTVLLLKPDGTFHSFGANAEKFFFSLTEDRHEWYYFSRFKMELYKNKELKSNMILKELNGKTMKAVQVFGLCIEYIKQKVVDRLSQAIDGLQDDDVHWVLTVPAIWNDQARAFMIQAAEKAGIDCQNLTLALEPESAAMYCRYLELEKKDDKQYGEIRTFKEYAKFMIVDLGGGTIDITVSEVLPSGQLKEIFNATGGPWGGNYINNEIMKTLTEIVGWPLMRQLRENDLESYLELEEEVEKSKRSVKYDKEFSLKIPELLRKEMVIGDQYKNQVTLKNRTLVFLPILLQKIFSSSVKSVILHVQNLLSKEQMKGVTNILLVGGYASCDIVQQAFKENFNDKYKIIFPLSPDTIVLKGAVISGHLKEPIVGRIAKYHYGLALRSKIVGRTLSLSEDEKKTFFSLIKKGQEIKVGDVVTQYEIVLETKTTFANVEVYTTAEEEPRQEIDEEHFTKIGSISVKLPRFKNQSVLILSISYDETEFKVVATDTNTGRCFVGICRFLETKE